MILKYIVPLLALAGAAFAVRMVVLGVQEVEVPPPVSEPARAPYDAYVAASGIVEASTENIAISVGVPGLVVAVDVEAGAEVAAGASLFRLDDRDARAAEAGAIAALEAARAASARLEALPRAENVRVLEARLASTEAALARVDGDLSRARSLGDPRALAREELALRENAVLAAGAEHERAEAELALETAGAWEPDRAVARAEVARAQALLAAARIETERRVIRAPCAGTVLQLNVRAGEFAASGLLERPLIVLGDTSRLHVRVDVDENETWRFQEGARARAYLRGNRDFSCVLAFVRSEPLVVPKRSLSGESTERVDTRVLQVLYRFDPAELPARVGQQLDIFVEAETPLGSR